MCLARLRTHSALFYPGAVVHSCRRRFSATYSAASPVSLHAPRKHLLHLGHSNAAPSSRTMNPSPDSPHSVTGCLWFEISKLFFVQHPASLVLHQWSFDCWLYGRLCEAFQLPADHLFVLVGTAAAIFRGGGCTANDFAIALNVVSRFSIFLLDPLKFVEGV